MGQLVALLALIAETNTMLLIGVMFVFMIIAYKVFQYVMRIVFVAAVFAAFPFIANFLGMAVPLTITSVVNYAVMGVTLFFAYASMRTGVRITRFILRPFKGSFRKKEKIIIREVERPKEQ